MAIDVRDRAAGERLMAAAGTHRPSEAIEDYAKAIYALQRRADGEPASSTNDLAERLRRHARVGLGDAQEARRARPRRARALPRRRLTPDGERVALEVLRHHRLLELYLAEHLGVPWDRVHEEAEALEHVISEDLEARIAAKLGNPTHDPHGDPIPDADLADRRGRRPARSPTLEAGRPRALRARLGLRPGDAALPRRARRAARRRARGGRPPAVRRPAHGPLRRASCTCSAAASPPRCASSSTRS